MNSISFSTRRSPITQLRARFGAIVAVAALALGVGGIAYDVDAAAKKKEEQKAPAGPALSKKVIPPLKAANDAMEAKQFETALAKLQEADAVAEKTPYDQFRIDEMRASVFVSTNKYADALAIYERHQTQSEYVEADLKDKRLYLMTQLAFRAQLYPKTLDYGKQWMEKNPQDTGVLDLMMRASYIGKDYKSAVETARAAIGIAEANGKNPEELWLNLIPSSLNSLQDHNAALVGYQKLVRYYPKPEHWNKSLDMLLALEKQDMPTLNTLRLMAETGVLTRPDYYLEYGQRAVDKALPGEAAKILQEGFDKKVLGASEKDKAAHQNNLKTAMDKAKADKAQLPEIEKETRASKATTGQLDAGLGLAYFSHQMYEQAIPALEQGLSKGGLRNTDDVRMVLGISYLRAGQKEKAREEFQKAAQGQVYAKVAPFWVSRTYN